MKGLKGVMQRAAETVAEKASSIKNLTQIEGNKLIESWLNILPTLQQYDLELTSFALGFSINPGLEVELKGKTDSFSEERIAEIVKEETGAAVRSVFQAIRTTIRLYGKTDDREVSHELLVSIKVRLSPEIKVFIGLPLSQ